MNPVSLVLANYLFFAREGTVLTGVGAGIVSAILKPAVAAPMPVDGIDPNWPTMGIVLDITPKTNIQKKEIIGPVGGRYGRVNIVPLSATLDFDATLANVDEKFFQLVMAGGALDEEGEYQPGVGSGIMRGWLKCQQYNAGTLTHKFDVYVSGEVKAPKEGNNNLEPVFTFQVIYSALAVGNVTLG